MSLFILSFFWFFRGETTGLLSEEEVKGQLATLEGWEKEGNSITRTYEFPSFDRAIAFINDVAKLASEAGHHPDIYNSGRTVTLSLTTHDEGGLTDRDIDLARNISTLDLE